MTALDHVVWAVPSIPPVAARLMADHGLRTLDGGSHQGWGTRNAIVPLGGPYLELVEVADPESATHGFGAAVRDSARDGGGLILWCVATHDIAEEADALGLHVMPGMRTNPDGGTVSWRVAGMPEALAAPDRPFLIQWDDPATAPGASPVAHPAGPVRATAMVIGGAVDHDAVPLDDGVMVGMRRCDRPGPLALHLATARGEVVITGGA